jgi:hypothetical protein
MPTTATIEIPRTLFNKLVVLGQADNQAIDQLAAALLAVGLRERLADRRAASPTYQQGQAQLRERLQEQFRRARP